MISPHQQYNSIDTFLVIQIRNLGIKLVNNFGLSGAPPPPAQGLPLQNCQILHHLFHLLSPSHDLLSNLYSDLDIVD